MPPNSQEKIARNETILVVDDIETNRLLLEAYLGRQGFNVLQAQGGAEALNIITEKLPDLVLLDIMMPEMDGTEVLRRLREKYTSGELPVIMVTAVDQQSSVVESINLGANDYITKPIDFPVLSARIGSQLLRKQAEDEARKLNNELEERVLNRTSELRRAYDVLKAESEERQRAQLNLRDSEEKYRKLYDLNPTTFLTIDAAGTLISVNGYGAAKLGYTSAELIGLNMMAIHADSDSSVLASIIKDCIERAGEPRTWEIRMCHKDGSISWARATGRSILESNGQPVVLVVCEDITETRYLTEQLTYEASHDSLTSLHNRSAFENELQHALDTLQSDSAVRHAVCYIDLDQFRIINDNFGHIAGDELLRHLASALGDKLRAGDTLARLGGDEFGFLLNDCSLECARQFADDLLKSISSFRFSWDGQHYSTGSSIGVVQVSSYDQSISDILSAADAACYAAKDLGGNRVHVYHPENEKLAQRHGEMQWVVKLKRALEENRLLLFAQPIVPVGNNSDSGLHYEVLVRLLDDDNKTVSPGIFLPAAERFNITTLLDRWVVRSTFQWLCDHNDHAAALSMCSINLSAQSLSDQMFLRDLVATFSKFGVHPEKICFEITETAAITDLQVATQFIRTLRKLGCKFALDDFGSGLSSFAYLRNLPVDFLKIDGLFVKNIVKDAINLAMVKSINEVGHVMGKKTIAEFVENDAILVKLGEIGVDYAQGYGIGIPVPIDEIS